MAYLRKDIIVLLGPSGCGKTTFGQMSLTCPYLSTASSTFLSTGDKLREENLIRAWWEPNMADIKDFCHDVISKTFTDFQTSDSGVLILDCVKDLEDAEFVAAQANKYGLKITRALLFDIDEKRLKQHWQERAENTDMLRMMLGSVHEYLYQWKKKSNDLINYYTNLKLLSKITDPSSYWWGISLYDYPICSPPNNLQFMLLDSSHIKNVFASLHSVLNVSQFQFSLPASFVHSYRDVKWVANPARYYVTIKADGVRCLLLKVSNGTYLITRKNEIYPCHIADDQLPENTVLDGELLPSSSNFMSEIHPKMSTSQLQTSVFLVFDVLAVSGEVLWKWPFSVRLESLGKLPIRKDIVAVMNQASTDDQSQANHKSSLVKEMLTVHCAIKGHRESTPEDILTCLNTEFPYSCDGLVFTPDKAYVFGPDPLTFKWQSEDDIHCDIRLSFTENEPDPWLDESDVFDWSRCYTITGCCNPFLMSHDESEVFECHWNSTRSCWEPLFARYDKAVPNSDETIAHLMKICQQPFTKDYFLCSLIQVRNFGKQEVESKSSEHADCGHPTRSFSFDELFSNLNELVQLGEVEKTVDVSTSLEIFSCRVSDSSSNPMMARLSRGLVLHPPSKTVVSRPFVRFYEDVPNRDLDEVVEATIKYDGSLGIAFLWNGEVMVTTKRRMDSEQAIWAKQWIKDHCNLTEFQTGYTYLFEIISQSNTVVVNYPFEGLVLLAITDEHGHELPYEDAVHCARTIGFFMVAPRITGSYSEVLWYCGGIKSSQETTTPNWPAFISGAMPANEKRQEGWVIRFNDGSRQKIVYRWWKSTSQLSQLVHPQVIWLLLKHDKIKEVFGNAPHHFQVEIRRMVLAIGRKFEETVRVVETCLQEPSSSNSLCDFDKCWGIKVDTNVDNLQRNEELKLSIQDSEGNYGRFCQLLNELKPYRHARSQFKNRRSLKVTVGRPDDVNLSPFYHHSKPNFLRLPILNYICPTSPALEGYEPGDNFKQTWCKGWKPISTISIDQWQFVQTILQGNNSVPVFLQLPVEVIVMILTFLDHASLTALAKVCVYLRQIVKSCKTSHLFKNVRKPPLTPYCIDNEEPWERSCWTYDEWETNHDIYGSW
ncbi:2 -5 RNA ligase [Paramuricea clavata]|uniref:2 -5 RNA ligase n=1 Tax=Paramuricea clavata TaxID=317549 RepID=A0A7D9J2M6_PARCT|nr:2 -5 RNA ligase [Paramuricea clavata]